MDPWYFIWLTLLLNRLCGRVIKIPKGNSITFMPPTLFYKDLFSRNSCTCLVRIVSAIFILYPIALFATLPDQLAPQTHVTSLPETTLFRGRITDSDADVVVVPTNELHLLVPSYDKDGRLISDYQAGRRHEEMSARLSLALGAGTDRVVYKKAQSMHPHFLMEPVFCSEGNIIVSPGWNPGQVVFYIPLSPKDSADSAKNRRNIQQLTERLRKMFEWSRENGKRSIDFTALGTGAYHWELANNVKEDKEDKDIIDIIQEAATEACFTGQNRIYILEEQEELFRRAQTKLNQETQIRTENENEMMVQVRVSNSKGIHIRPSTVLARYFAEKGLTLVQAKNITQKNLVEQAPLNFMLLMLAASGGDKSKDIPGDDLLLKIKIPEGTDKKKIEDDLQRFFANFDAFDQRSQSVDEFYREILSAGEDSKEKTGKIYAAPSDFNFQSDALDGESLVDPIFIETGPFGLSNDYLILNYIPADPASEMNRFNMVVKHMITEASASKRGTEYLAMLLRFQSYVNARLKANPRFNAEYLIAKAGEEFYSNAEMTFRESQRPESLYINRSMHNLIRGMARSLIEFVREPFYLNYEDTSPEQLEAIHFHLGKKLPQIQEPAFRLIEHITDSAPLRDQMKESVRKIISQISVDVRVKNLIPWVALYKGLWGIAQEFPPESEEYQVYAVLSRLTLLYWLSNEYVTKGLFDITNIEKLLDSMQAQGDAVEKMKNLIGIEKARRTEEKQGLFLTAENLYVCLLPLLHQRNMELLNKICEATELESCLKFFVPPEKKIVLALTRDRLQSLRHFPKRLYVSCILIKDNELKESSPSILSLKDLFPYARIIICPQENADFSGQMQGIVSFSDGRFIASPKAEDYAKAEAVNRALSEEMPALSNRIPLTRIFSHHHHPYHRVLEGNAPVIHFSNYFKHESDSRLMPSEESLINYLEQALGHTREGQIVVKLFQNSGSESRLTGLLPEYSSKATLQAVIKAQLGALDKFSATHPGLELCVAPQNTGDESFFYSLVKPHFDLKGEGSKIKLMQIITDPREKMSAETVYLKLDAIAKGVEPFSNGSSNSSDFSDQGRQMLFRWLTERLSSIPSEDQGNTDVFLVGHLVSNPAVALFIEALNIKRAEAGLHRINLVVNDENQYWTKRLLSSVDEKRLKELGDKIIHSTRDPEPSSEALREFDLWVGESLRTLYNVTLPDLHKNFQKAA